MIRDRQRLARRIASLEGRGGRRDEQAYARLVADIEAAQHRRRERAAARPEPTYPADLPVSAHREEILDALRAHQAVVVAGETGSGKTTQLPKMCLELGRGIDGLIGHTQPRRIAARTVAERLAEELEVPLGTSVGYAVRFSDTVGEQTLVKVMTDGILLAEIRRDRQLSAYDTIIVDEAHERSLNIDFLLGYLAELLPRRPDLKVVITSATIDTARFAAHFGAPVVEVTGRTYPVEIRYRPPQGGGDAVDWSQAVVDAVHEALAEGPGDALVFLPGERDIRDAAEALAASGPRDVEILPLYARLTVAEQHRVFQAHRRRRVVLATNVAETSLTVPGVRFVIDTGLARVSRYSHRTKVQRLPIEPVSRASADQRAGRCGRTGPGICWRLYGEEDYLGRAEFTDPEILRTNLASVILQMAAIGLGEIEVFPFLEPPDRRAIADGRALLEELGAFVREGGRLRLTAVGRRLAELPLDPRLGRMVLEAERRNCLREVTVIAAALSIQDPRERPLDAAREADAAHARFVVEGSDFLAYVALWDYVASLKRELSGNQFRRRLRGEFLSVLRVREWQDVAGQIRQVLRAAGAHANSEPAHPDEVHRALLAGLLSHLGMRDRVRGDYRGARDLRWQIARSSSLAAHPPPWAVAGELVETSRTYARVVARVTPSDAEKVGAHLVKRRYSAPVFDPARGEVVAEERVSLYGLPLVAGRRVHYARLDPSGARALFIQHGLVEGAWEVPLAPLERTARRRAEIAALEARARRHDLLRGDEALFGFYDERLPDAITGGRLFLRWWKRTEPVAPGTLDPPDSVLADPAAGPLDTDAFPDALVTDDLVLPLRYRWAPGAPDDGVTVVVPLASLAGIDPAPLSWHVPGHRAALVAALVRSLPRATRRALAPLTALVSALVAELGPSDGALGDVLAAAIARRSGEPVTPGMFSPAALPAHLRLHLEVVDTDGRVCAQGDDVGALQAALAADARAAIAARLAGFERHGATRWEFGDLPARVAAGGVRGYPALVDEGDAVGVVLVETPEAAAELSRHGLSRLLVLVTPLDAGHLARHLSGATRRALARAELPVAEVLDHCAAAVADAIVDAQAETVRSAAGFAVLAAQARAELEGRVARLADSVGAVLEATERVDELVWRLESTDATGLLAPALADVRHQVDDLVHPGFITDVGEAHLADVARYLEAAHRRLERLSGDRRRDAERQACVGRVLAAFDAAAARVEAAGSPAGERARLAEARLLVEELRVSLWAQSLRTPVPVSEDRLIRLLADIAR